MGLDLVLTDWANRHHGLLTLDRWLKASHSRRSWYRALDSGILIAAQPGVARLPGAPDSAIAAIAAAVWSINGAAPPRQRSSRERSALTASARAVNAGAMASHRSCAHLWGANVGGRDPIDLIVPKRLHTTAAEGIVVHRPRDVLDMRPIQRSGIATCNPLRCLLDLGAVAPNDVAGALESFLIAGLVSYRAVTTVLARHRIRGRHGVVALADALDQLALGDRRADSALETMFARLLADHHLVDWSFHHRVAGYEIDFAFVEARLAIEVDGWAAHGPRHQFQRDRRRDVELAAAGWIVLRFTWLQITRRPTWVADKVRAALTHRTGLGF